MRKRYRVLILAILAAALVVPVGFALSLESPLPVHDSATLMASVTQLYIPDAAGLFLVGAGLVGFAALVRKRA